MSGAAPQFELFTCARKPVRLSAAGCARMWLGAQDSRPAPWEGRAACVACPVGAKHAGCEVSPVAAEVLELRRVCGRCFRFTPRLVNGRFCASCFNRHAEVLRGRNGKGGTPRLCRVLHDERLTVRSGAVSLVVRAEKVANASEAMVNLARKAKSMTAFGWPPAEGGNYG